MLIHQSTKQKGGKKEKKKRNEKAEINIELIMGQCVLVANISNEWWEGSD